METHQVIFFLNLLVKQHEGNIHCCSYEKMWFDLLCDPTPQSHCVSPLVYISWLARNENAFVAVTSSSSSLSLFSIYPFTGQSQGCGNSRVYNLVKLQLSCTILLIYNSHIHKLQFMIQSNNWFINSIEMIQLFWKYN